jgi:lipopolysaccharide biosynthesis protein
LVFPDDPHILGWGKNLPYAVSLAQRLGVSEPLPRNTFNFPVGSMFWARTAALRPLFELGLSWDDYPEEPVPYDGSLLHAIERILPFVAESAGFRSAVTHVSGVTR